MSKFISQDEFLRLASVPPVGGGFVQRRLTDEEVARFADGDRFAETLRQEALPMLKEQAITWFNEARAEMHPHNAASFQPRIELPFDTVVTHPGVYHADEVIPCSIMLAVKPTLTIARRMPTLEDLENTRTMVLDVGNQLDSGKLNLDHHQDPSLLGAASLWWNWIEFTCGQAEYDRVANMLYLLANKLYHIATAYDFQFSLARWTANLHVIGAMDVGHRFDLPDGDKSLTSLIAACNDSFTFEQVVKTLADALSLLLNPPQGELEIIGYGVAQVARMFNEAQLHQAEQAARMRATWAEHVKPCSAPRVCVYTGPGFIGPWKEHAAEVGVDFLIFQDQKEDSRNFGKFVLNSRSTDEGIIVLDGCEGQTYRHPSGFMAVYSSLEQAVEAGINSLNNEP